ncbi:MAG: hypothetical protein Ct9H300mP32_5460 [Verrucomicrobiota bacterium]|nr:MAG: hypothetical protein Ct9H300mP32_5460 [Verrucomicrobiota bacterium]
MVPRISPIPGIKIKISPGESLRRICSTASAACSVTGSRLRFLAEANVDRKRASVGGEHPAGIGRLLAQVAGDRAGLNGCRHDNELKVGAFVGWSLLTRPSARSLIKLRS